MGTFPRFRLTVRGKLTLIYTAVFTIGGLLLLSYVYLIVADSLASRGDELVQAVQVVPNDDWLSGQTGSGQILKSPGAPASYSASAPKQVVASYNSAVLSDLLLRSAVAMLVIIALAALAGRYIAGRALARLHHITDTARHLSEHDLGRRLALPGPHDELKELGDTFDAMLTRLQSAFDSQSRFAANASHELRTPLTIQRAAVEVPLTSGQVPEHLLPAMNRVLSASRRSEHLIENLLLLARGDRGLAETRRLDLADVARDVAEVRAQPAAAAEVDLRLRLRRAWVQGDVVLLDHLLGNLIDNAVRYNVPGGWVEVTTRAGADSAKLIVANTGPDLTSQQVEQLFEPFRRGDGERLRHDAAGSGLGLSIVRSIARAHHGTVAANARPEGGLIVTVTLPTPTCRMADE
ncbi:ATP-binding protein [Sphaerisporangium sp. NBC_01403]|uniref:sensor histidine kinase n=1 Tax=Sphaerisporangium sp. NBC_01403 TaxID=2903599 RepID=UPI0032516D23